MGDRLVLKLSDYAEGADADPEVAARLRRLRESPKPDLHAAVGPGRFPGIAGTDSVFMEGRQLDGSQFATLPAGVGAGYVRRARAAGVNPAGKYYAGGLARFPGDPRAWVSSRSDVQKVCESNGWACDGAVKVEQPRYADGYVPGKYKVAPSIVREEVRRRVAADPSLAPRAAEVTAEVSALRSGVHGGS